MKGRKSLPPVIQPVKCRGCIWGKWQDTTQFCSRVRCPKDATEEFQNPKRLGLSREVPR